MALFASGFKRPFAGPAARIHRAATRNNAIIESPIVQRVQPDHSFLLLEGSGDTSERTQRNRDASSSISKFRHLLPLTLPGGGVNCDFAAGP
jgi:hypothetical protein